MTDMDWSDEGEDMGRNSITSMRPKFLGEYLDAQATHYSVFDDKYFGFLQSAVEALEDGKNSPISTNVILKMGKAGKRVHNPEVHHYVGRPDDDTNNNFGKLFYFYSSFGEVVQGSSFEKIGEEKRSWSHTELEVFLRDFGVIPKLLSKEDMREVWEDASNYRIQRYEKALSQLEIEEGKEMMARIALFIYMRSGMKKMILATQGTFPSPEEMVSCLIHYMRIDDTEFVDNHIREGKGRQTQGKLNYVSASEEKEINKEHIADDLLYKGFKHEAIKSKMRDKNRNRSVLVSSGGPRRRPQRDDIRKQEEDHIPSSIRAMLAAPQPKIEKSSRPNTSQSADGGGGESRPSTAELTGEEKEKDVLGTYAPPLDSRTVSPKAPKEVYYDSWTPALQKIFDKYCREPLGTHNDPNLEASRAPFLDAGHVEMGTPLTVFINVKNRSAHELDVDVHLRNFEDENEPKVISREGFLAPGMTRQLQVNMVSDYSVRSVVGIIEVSLRNVLQAFDEVLDIPMFFYTGPYVLLGGDRVPKPVTAETVRARYSNILAEKVAAGLVMDDSIVVMDVGTAGGAQDREDLHSVGLSTVSSLKGNSVSLAGVDGVVADKSDKGSNEGSLATQLSTTFSRSRSSWYKEKTVGGGGRTLKAYRKDRFLAGSGASVASGLRSAATSMRSAANTGVAASANASTPSLRRREADVSRLFDDGSVMTFS